MHLLVFACALFFCSIYFAFVYERDSFCPVFIFHFRLGYIFDGGLHSFVILPKSDCLQPLEKLTFLFEVKAITIAWIRGNRMFTKLCVAAQMALWNRWCSNLGSQFSEHDMFTLENVHREKYLRRTYQNRIDIYDWNTFPRNDYLFEIAGIDEIKKCAILFFTLVGSCEKVSIGLKVSTADI